MMPHLGLAVAGLLLAAPPPAADATRQITYQGTTFTVPADWPVFDLAADPATCVRFDRHAVYVGRPAPDQRCPSAAMGRTEALLVEPATASAAKTVENPVDQTFVATTGGVRVTIAYGSNRAAADRIRSDAGLPTPTAAAPAAAPSRFTPLASAGATNHTGAGFDACAAPSGNAMNAWKASSPYSAVGVYIGGVNRACQQPNLTADWVNQRESSGWRFLLLYVGPQAATTSCPNCSLITEPSTQGSQSADDAIAKASALGFGPGSLICYDMESWESGQNGRALPFLDAWTRQLHARGYRSAVYSSAGTGIRQMVANFDSYAMPDVVDFANWNNNPTTSDPNIPAHRWANHQRIHQYRGGHDETYGGYRINVDSDYFDVQLGSVAGETTLTQASVLVNPHNGNLQIYSNSGGRLVERYWSEASGWVTNQMGVPISGAPVAVVNPANGNIQVYMTWNGQLAEMFWSPSGGWSGLNPLGGTVTGHPAVMVNPSNGNVQVHYNSGGRLAENYWDKTTGGWSGEHVLGGSITGSPAVVINPSNGNLQVHYNAGGQLAENYWSPATGWSGQNLLGGTMTGDPAIVVNPHNDNVQIHYNAGGQLAENYWNPASGWSGQNLLGGSITGTPAVFVNPHNRFVQIHYDAGGQLAENYWDPATGWSGQNLLGGSVTSDPAVVVNPRNQNVQVHYSTGDALGENYWNPSGGWSGHHTIG